MSGDEVVLNCLRVLVVDDDADTQDLIAFVLEEYGTEVIRAASAIEALKIIAQFQPELLLIDIAMPGLDGYTLLRQIRTLEAESKGRIPAIAITASATENAPALTIEAGFQFYLPQPFDLAELVTAVAQLAGRN
jgi:CheY-like chemotaxis protein